MGRFGDTCKQLSNNILAAQVGFSSAFWLDQRCKRLVKDVRYANGRHGSFANSNCQGFAIPSYADRHRKGSGYFACGCSQTQCLANVIKLSAAPASRAQPADFVTA